MPRDEISRWKLITIINLILSLASLWLIYSQNIYITQLLSERPIAIAHHSPTTAIVINPFSGYFVAVDSQVLFGAFVSALVVILFLLSGKKLKN